MTSATKPLDLAVSVVTSDALASLNEPSAPCPIASTWRHPAA